VLHREDEAAFRLQKAAQGAHQRVYNRHIHQRHVADHRVETLLSESEHLLFIGRVGHQVLHSVAVPRFLGTGLGQLDESLAEVHCYHPRPEFRKPPREDTVAAGDVEHRLAG
jgi:hypothetical protein